MLLHSPMGWLLSVQWIYCGLLESSLLIGAVLPLGALLLVLLCFRAWLIVDCRIYNEGRPCMVKRPERYECNWGTRSPSNGWKRFDISHMQYDVFVVYPRPIDCCVIAASNPWIYYYLGCIFSRSLFSLLSWNYRPFVRCSKGLYYPSDRRGWWHISWTSPNI